MIFKVKRKFSPLEPAAREFLPFELAKSKYRRLTILSDDRSMFFFTNMVAIS